MGSSVDETLTKESKWRVPRMEHSLWWRIGRGCGWSWKKGLRGWSTDRGAEWRDARGRAVPVGYLRPLQMEPVSVRAGALRNKGSLWKCMDDCRWITACDKEWESDTEPVEENRRALGLMLGLWWAQWP